MNKKILLIGASLLVLLTTGCASSVSKNIGEASVATIDARNTANAASQDASAVMLSVSSLDRIVDAADEADRSAVEKIRLTNVEDWGTFNASFKAQIDQLKKQTASSMVVSSD